MGGVSSIFFTMWFGFGQTFARNYANVPSALESSPLLSEWKNATNSLFKPTKINGCADDWWYNGNKTLGISVFDTETIEDMLTSPNVEDASDAT